MKKISLLLVSLLFASQLSFTLNGIELDFTKAAVNSTFIIPFVQAINCITIPTGIVHGIYKETKNNPGTQSRIVSLIKGAGKGTIKGAHIGTVGGLFLVSFSAAQVDKMSETKKHDHNEKQTKKSLI